jgi:iron complex outermembrane recepter protein
MKSNTDLRRLLCLSAILSASGVQVLPAWAEDAPSAESAGLEEITVTARRRDERLQDVPISVSAFTAATIRDARIENVKDVAARVPNFSIVEAQQPGVALINVRGVGQARNGEPPVAMVIDGVETSNPAQITQSLFDVESIEVLKGPQGAVYGRNAIGGAIIVTTRRPTNDFAGAIEVSTGTGSDNRASGYLSGPIIPDRLLFRMSAAWRDFDGDIDSLNTPGHPKANPDRNTDVRLNVLGKISSDVSVDVRYSRLDQTAGAAWYVPVAPGESIDEPRPYVGAIPGTATRKLDDGAIKIDADFTGMRFTSISAYSKIETQIHESLSYTQVDGLSALQAQDTNNVSQEFRLSSAGDTPLKWLAGVYFLHSRLPQDTTVFLDSGFFPLFGVPPGTPSPIPLSVAKVTNTEKAYAAFGQVSYRYSSGWELAGALRADVDDRSQVDRVAAGTPEYSKRFQAVQPKIDLSYHFDADTMAYASVGEGFRSGGFNATARITRVYDPEKNWSAETGFKTSLLGNRVNLSAAAYYTRVTDRQVYVLDITDSAQTIANPVPRAEIYGVEFDLLARPVPQLDLSLSGGLANSKVLSYNAKVFAGLPVQGDFTGNKLPQTPGYSYAASAQYRFTLPSSLTLVPRLEFNGSGGDYYWELDNKNKRRAIDLVNVRLSLNSGPFSLTGYAENLFDAKYVLEFVPAAWSGSVSGDVSAAAPGRRVGVALRYDF